MLEYITMLQEKANFIPPQLVHQYQASISHLGDRSSHAGNIFPDPTIIEPSWISGRYRGFNTSSTFANSCSALPMKNHCSSSQSSKSQDRTSKNGSWVSERPSFASPPRDMAVRGYAETWIDWVLC
ncbi:hypothetical protein LIA77_04987 [Sarocladium implicatum]|nr:hypothetical protein LIA77_04987 [Sarocladium implicatum]